MLLNFTSKHNRFCKNALNPILILLVLPFSPNFVIYYYRNQSAENLFGYPASEALGQDALMLLVDSRDHNVVNDIFRRISMGESWTGKFPVKNRGGDRFSAIATNTPFYDEDGSLVGIICLSSDSRHLEQIFCRPPTPARPQPESSRTSCDGSCSNTSRTTNLLNRSTFDPQQPQQSTLASKITNLVSSGFLLTKCCRYFPNT
jgi:PAS domain S-box-containing protein